MSIVRKLILDLVLFIAIYHGYYGPHITFVDSDSNKTYQRLHKNRAHMNFSLKVRQIYSVPFTMISILYFQYGCPCFVIM